MRVLHPPRLGLLGEAAILVGSGATALDIQPKTLALAAYAACAEAPVSRRVLAELLFSDAENPRGALRWHLARLRAVLPGDLGDRLRSEHHTVALDLPTDVLEFRTAASRCLHSFEPEAAAATLALYRGDFLAGLAVSASAEFDLWLVVLGESLRTLFRRLAIAFGRWAIDAGRAPEALQTLGRLVAVDPYQDEGHVLLIQAIVAASGRDAARAAYDRYSRMVREDLHAEPRPEVRDLYEPAAAPADQLPRDGFATLSNVTLHFVEWPGGDPPLLCLHGATASGYVYSALARHLAPEYRMVAPALRGNGFSDKPVDGYSGERHVSDLLELMRALRIERPVIIGHSTGGSIAALLAERCGARGLILLDGIVGERSVFEDRCAAARILASPPAVRVFDLPRYMEGMRPTMAPNTHEAELLLDRVSRLQFVRMPDGSYRNSIRLDGVQATWASLLEADTIGALRRVDIPVLVTWAARPWLPGTHGPYLSEAIVRAQRQAARHGEMVIAARSTHASLIRDPEPVIIAAIRRLLYSVLALDQRAAGPGVAERSVLA